MTDLKTVRSIMPWGGVLYLIPDDIICDTMLGPRGAQEYAVGQDPVFADGNFWDGELLLPIFNEALRDPHPFIINIGAFVGHEAVYLAQRGAMVFAFEVNPDLAKIATQNIVANNLQARIDLYNYAAYHRPAYFAPELREGHSIGSLCWLEVHKKVGGIEGGPIDDFRMPPSRVTLIECDAQGADLRALQGLTRTIETDRPLIVFEFEEDLALKHGTSWANYTDFFETHHYDLEGSKTHKWNFVARPR